MQNPTQYVSNSAKRVPLPSGAVSYINFDNAASTPAFDSVKATVESFIPWYSSVHRGSGIKSQISTRAYDEAHNIIQDFVGANSNDHCVIFGKNTTEAINKLAYRLRLTGKDIVLTSGIEHHSNDLPWRAKATVKYIKTTNSGGIDKQDFLRLLTLYKGRVRLLAITGASNVTGYMPDIHWYAEQAHANNMQILVDGAQLAAHRNINMKPLSDPAHLDYVAISAHKMYAPFGSGALIGRKDTFETGSPEYSGGGTVSFVTKSLVDWADSPDKDEAGSPNVIGAVAFAAAAKQLRGIGFDSIAAYEASLTSYALTQLANVPGVTLYGDSTAIAAHTRAAVIPFTVKDKPHGLVAAILSYEWGIGVRNGCFCAQPYVASLLNLTRRDIAITRRQLKHGNKTNLPGFVRISFGLYNTTQEIDKLIAALHAIAQNKHKEYLQDSSTGDYSPNYKGYSLEKYWAL